MKKFKSIMMMGIVLLIVTLSKPAMALDLSSFTDIPNFSVVIGASMFTLDYANDSANANQISAAILENKGDVFIKTDDTGWIKNNDGTQVNQDAVDISTIKYNNGQELVPIVPTVPILPSTVTQIQINPTITITGTNTATFTYKILDQSGIDITKIIPTSQISAIASVNSTIVLDPLTSTGTITYNSSADVDTSINITLTDKVTGLTINSEMVVPGGEMEAPKVGKIIVNSTELGVAGQNGYATFSVYDQYGNDVTNSSLGDNVIFMSAAGIVTTRYGLITITANAGIDFSRISTVVINGYDLESGVSTTATLGIEN